MTDDYYDDGRWEAYDHVEEWKIRRDREDAPSDPPELTAHFAGVYEIRCKANGRRYVGSSFDVGARWDRHLRDLEAGEHVNGELQEDWNRFPAGCWEVNVLEKTRSPRTAEARVLGSAENFLALYNVQRNVDASDEEATYELGGIRFSVPAQIKAHWKEIRRKGEIGKEVGTEEFEFLMDLLRCHPDWDPDSEWARGIVGMRVAVNRDQYSTVGFEVVRNWDDEQVVRGWSRDKCLREDRLRPMELLGTKTVLYLDAGDVILPRVVGTDVPEGLRRIDVPSDDWFEIEDVIPGLESHELVVRNGAGKEWGGFASNGRVYVR